MVGNGTSAAFFHHVQGYEFKGGKEVFGSCYLGPQRPHGLGPRPELESNEPLEPGYELLGHLNILGRPQFMRKVTSFGS